MRSLYLLLIIAANLLTAKFSPFSLFDGALIIPVGSVFAGAVFILRDLVQIKHGKAATYTLIAWATVLSTALSIMLGDVAYIAAASVLAFFASEAIDTEIFSRLRKSLAARILLSGIVGGCVDSALFVVLGLSPIGANMLPWAAVPSAIAGQMLVKILVQFPAAGYAFYRNKQRKDLNKRKELSWKDFTSL